LIPQFDTKSFSSISVTRNYKETIQYRIVPDMKDRKKKSSLYLTSTV